MSLSKEDVNDYLMRGIHGPPELRRDEKIRYLGEFRERIVLALTQAQVRRPDIPRQVRDAIAAHPDVTVVLNGEMEYRAISKYIRLANEKNLPYRKIYDNEHDTEIGLVLAAPEAVDIASIYLSEKPASKAVVQSADKPAAKRKLRRRIARFIRRRQD